jgi:hypothetical protein
MPRRLLAAALAALFTALFAYCAWWSIRIFRAGILADDRSLATTRAALLLTPADPALSLQLAHAFPVSDPNVEPALQTALRRNPFNSAFWLDAAALAEDRLDYPAAEARLLHAVEIDRTFAPRWLLAEFYARRRNLPRFWPAMHAALATSYDDVSPLFDTCWSIAPDPAAILPLAVLGSDPPRPDVLSQYLDFLLAKQRLDLTPPVTALLLPNADAKSTPSLLTASDRFLWYNQPAPALRIWNALAAARLIPLPPLNPAAAPALTNARFQKPFLQQAFDWRLAAAPGISASQELDPPDSAFLRFEFSGKQVEHAELASQFVLLPPGRRFRLAVDYRSSPAPSVGIAPLPDTGIHLHLTGGIPPRDLLAAASPLRNAADPGPQQQLFLFATPSANPNGLYRLTLTYDRAIGETRFEGAVLLYQFTLVPDPHSS